MKNYKLTALDKVLVTHPIKIEDDSVKNAIISSAYKISVLRDKVSDSLFFKEGNFHNQWLKSGELTKLSLLKKDLMEYIEPKENNSNSLNGETKKTDWNNLPKNLKATVLSFLIAPKEETPKSINYYRLKRGSLCNAYKADSKRKR